LPRTPSTPQKLLFWSGRRSPSLIRRTAYSVRPRPKKTEQDAACSILEHHGLPFHGKTRFSRLFLGGRHLCRHLAFFLCAAGQGIRTAVLFLCATGGLASRGRMGRQDCLPETLPRFFEG
ncbi:MAG TPA: hypothetical protein H9774_11370, partial [Candidatus Desulfovibrio gallistercoris]|nr:hypothetical protein [Candidatus Desulfovibrio gallistercoris]